MTRRRTETLVWVGTAGAPVAAALEHVATYMLSEARCGPVNQAWGVAFSTWIALVTVVTAITAGAGIAASFTAFRALRGETGIDGDPPPGRMWLMASFGLVICPLLLAVILLDGIGALLLGSCHQG